MVDRERAHSTGVRLGCADACGRRAAGSADDVLAGTAADRSVSGRHDSLRLADRSRRDPSSPSGVRELMVQFWYPAQSTRGYAVVPYMPTQVAQLVERYYRIPDHLVERLRTRAYADVRSPPRLRPLPTHERNGHRRRRGDRRARCRSGRGEPHCSNRRDARAAAKAGQAARDGERRATRHEQGRRRATEVSLWRDRQPRHWRALRSRRSCGPLTTRSPAGLSSAELRYLHSPESDRRARPRRDRRLDPDRAKRCEERRVLRDRGEHAQQSNDLPPGIDVGGSGAKLRRGIGRCTALRYEGKRRQRLLAMALPASASR